MRPDAKRGSQTPAAAIPPSSPPGTPAVAPPLADVEVYRTANMIVTRYGDDAPRFASQQMERFRQRGEPKEQAVWARIGMAADELLFAKAEIQRSME